MKLVDFNIQGEVLAIFTGLEEITIDTKVPTGLTHVIYEDETKGPTEAPFDYDIYDRPIKTKKGQKNERPTSTDS